MKKREKKLRKILKSIDESIMNNKIKKKIKNKFFMSYYSFICERYIDELKDTNEPDLKKYII